MLAIGWIGELESDQRSISILTSTLLVILTFVPASSFHSIIVVVFVCWHVVIYRLQRESYTYKEIILNGGVYVQNSRRISYSKLSKYLFPLLLLILAIYEIQQTARGVDVGMLRNEVSQLHPWELALIIIVSFCAVTPMFFYDIILVKLLGIKMKTRKLIRHSFIANTFSNLIGFGGLVGLMLRSYFYSKHKEEKEGHVKKYCFRHTLLFNGNFIVSMDCSHLFLGFPAS